jgi:hypothetical protein
MNNGRAPEVVENKRKWTMDLKLPSELIKRFEVISNRLDLSPSDLSSGMMRQVVEMDDELERYGLPRLGAWRTKSQVTVAVEEENTEALPGSERGLDWAADFDWPEELIQRFEVISQRLDLSPADLLARMMKLVVGMEDQLEIYGVSGLGLWEKKADMIVALTEHSTEALPVDIRRTGFMWPSGLAFPWSADECKAAVVGYEVRWHGDFEDFVNKLRGLWEMSDRFAFLKQS